MRTIVALHEIRLFCPHLRSFTASTSFEGYMFEHFMNSMNLLLKVPGRLMEVTAGTVLNWFWNVAPITVNKDKRLYYTCLRRLPGAPVSPAAHGPSYLIETVGSAKRKAGAL